MAKTEIKMHKNYTGITKTNKIDKTKKTKQKVTKSSTEIRMKNIKRKQNKNYNSISEILK